MSLNIELLTQKIDKLIMEIVIDYQNYQGIILTEDDLKCIIYQRLMNIPELCKVTKTEDDVGNIYATSVHSEISWFDDRNKLTIKPDLTILEPEYLRILKGRSDRPRLPSKEFAFYGKAIIFELKFIRPKTGITLKRFQREIEADYIKIQRLFNRLDSQKMPKDVYCFFVIFNKTNLVCQEFIGFLEEKGQSFRHKIIYGSGNIILPNNR